MKIFLIYVTKTGPVNTGLHLHHDRHVDLGYRVVESGIAGISAKKNWCFALIEAGEVKASIPMYRPSRVAKQDVTVWAPRIPERDVRGSFRVLCEVLLEKRETQTTEALRSALREADEPALPVVGNEPSPDGDFTRLFTEAYEAWELRADGSPAPEIIHFPDGTKQLVTQWGQAEMPELVGVVAASPESTEEETPEVGSTWEGDSNSVH